MDFSSLATPFTKLMGNKEKFVWLKDCEKSFQELKKRLTTAPVLTLPSGSGDFVNYNEASLYGLGPSFELFPIVS